jgi:hypothetical protein
LALFLLAAASVPAVHAEDKPEVSFGGQYRINNYGVENDDAGEDDQTASRLRVRQNIDLKLPENLAAHLQFELGHTSGNVTTTEMDVKVRHAVLRYETGGGAYSAGILPVSDRFGDVLFSSAWDYNPVAAMAELQAGGGELQVVAGVLDEGLEDESQDDTTHYQLDYSHPWGKAHWNLGLSVVGIPDADGRSRGHWNGGAGVRFPIRRAELTAYLLASGTNRELLASSDDGSGVAGVLSLTRKFERAMVGLLLSRAQSGREGDGFLPVMSVVGTNGYWGYTGILTVQGPTDTGFDGDALNVSNNGYGLTSVQARYLFPITERFDGYVAAGWFGATDAPGRDSTVGRELMGMGTFHVTKILAVDFGVAVADLGDSVSGYSLGAAGGFTQPAGVDRTKTVLFLRLQAEF